MDRGEARRPACGSDSVSPERASRVPRGRYCVSVLQRAHTLTVVGTVHTDARAHSCTHTRLYVYVHIRFVHAGYQAACVRVHAHSEGTLHVVYAHVTAYAEHVHTPVRRAFPRRRRRRTADSLAGSRGASRVCVSSVTRLVLRT